MAGGYGLNIEIKKEYENKEFWKLIKCHPQGISMIRFSFSYPNLPRVHQSINELINSESKVVQSKQTTLEYKANNQEQLLLDESNQQLSDLVDASASSGHSIIIKARGFSKHLQTGNTTKRIDIEDLEVHIQEGSLFKDVIEEIIERLNSLK